MANKIFLRIGAWYRATAKQLSGDIEMSDIIDDVNAQYPEADGGESGGLGYLAYTALLTQTGTDAPVATVLENTLSGAIVWAYDAEGTYRGSLAGQLFAVEKTLLACSANNGITTPIALTNDEDGTLVITTTADGNLYYNYVEIIVYP